MYKCLTLLYYYYNKQLNSTIFLQLFICFNRQYIFNHHSQSLHCSVRKTRNIPARAERDGKS